MCMSLSVLLMANGGYQCSYIESYWTTTKILDWNSNWLACLSPKLLVYDAFLFRIGNGWKPPPPPLPPRKIKLYRLANHLFALCVSRFVVKSICETFPCLDWYCLLRKGHIALYCIILNNNKNNLNLKVVYSNK